MHGQIETTIQAEIKIVVSLFKIWRPYLDTYQENNYKTQFLIFL